MRRTSTVLITLVLGLISLGIVMLASVSSVRGEALFGDPHFFLKRQLIWVGLACAGGILAARFDYHWWQHHPIPILLFGVTLVALVSVFVPGIGHASHGSHRWVWLLGQRLQPSEFVKLTVIVLMSLWMAHVGRKARCFLEGFCYPLLGMGLVLGLILIEPDYGTTALLGTVGFLIMYAAGTRIQYLVVAGIAAAGGFALIVLKNPNRLRRLLAFIDPSQNPTAAHQLEQAKVALGMGGLQGAGLGNSIQKRFYLPEAHTDFILAIIGEELGFVATGLIVLVFLGIVICGILISLHAVDKVGRLMAFGLTMLIGLQAAINVGVVTGVLPTKGLALPFLSYGGSSLLVSVFAVSMLLNIARHVDETDAHTQPIKDVVHRF